MNGSDMADSSTKKTGEVARRAAPLPPRQWLAGLFQQETLAASDRTTLLAGRAPQQGPDPGPTVCSCFGVGRNTICAAIRTHGLETTAQVTACVKAGGNFLAKPFSFDQLARNIGAALA